MRDWQADFAVFDENGQLALVVEATNKRHAAADWATGWYRNYLAHSWRSQQPFVLLATPDKLYVWKPGPNAQPTPAAIADARRVFSSYLHDKTAKPADLSGRTFEFVVGAWLNDLSHRLWQPSNREEISALIDTGLAGAIANGRVVSDVAA